MPLIKPPSLPTVRPNASVGLLGGSFDPPHIGHALLSLSFLALEPIEELWVIPCQNHAFKGALSEFSHRFAMCEIAFRRIKQVRVLDIENHLLSPNYTIETINYMVGLRPDLRLLLALGSDLIDSFHLWRDANLIVQKITPVIFERAAHPITTLPDLLKTAHIHQGYALPDTSSTALRSFFIAGKKGPGQHLVDRDVLAYIQKHHLYTV